MQGRFIEAVDIVDIGTVVEKELHEQGVPAQSGFVQGHDAVETCEKYI